MWPKIILNQYGGLKECPYFKRSIVDFGPFSFRLHTWYADDDHRAMHDHPTWFWTFVLKGGYTDVSENGKDRLGRFSVRYRPAEYKHSVQDVIPGTTTFLIFGKPFRRWGFWLNGKLVKRDKYFAEQGHHPCDPADKPVRMRPNGERIK